MLHRSFPVIREIFRHAEVNSISRFRSLFSYRVSLSERGSYKSIPAYNLARSARSMSTSHLSSDALLAMQDVSLSYVKPNSDVLLRPL